MPITAKDLELRFMSPDRIAQTRRNLRELGEAVKVVNGGEEGARRSMIRMDLPRDMPEKNQIPELISDRDWNIAKTYINDPNATLVSVGESHGISRERVRQVIARAYRMWRKSDWRGE